MRRHRQCWLAYTLWALGGCSGGGGVISALPSSALDTGAVSGQIVAASSLESRRLSLQSPLANFRVSVQDTVLSAPVAPDGSFRLDNVPVGLQTVTAYNGATNDGAHLVVSVTAGQLINTGQIVPRPMGSMAGTVTGSTANGRSRPLANARVMAVPLIDSNERLGNLANGRPHLIATTDARGEYVIRGALPGSHMLTVRQPGFGTGTLLIEVTAHGTALASFGLAEAAAGATVRGVVTASLGGPPVPLQGVLVVVLPIESPPAPPSAGGFEATGGGGGSSSTRTRVQDLTIAQIANAARPNSVVLRAAPHHQLTLSALLFTFTGADGRFELHSVPPGFNDYLCIKDGFLFESRSSTLDVGDGWQSGLLPGMTADLTVTMRRARLGRVTGLVTDRRTGSPIIGASVFASREDPFVYVTGNTPPPPLSPVLRGERGRTVLNSPSLPTAASIAGAPPIRSYSQCDASGYYELSLESGYYRLLASAYPHSSQTSFVSIGLESAITMNFQLDPLLPSNSGLTVGGGAGGVSR